MQLTNYKFENLSLYDKQTIVSKLKLSSNNKFSDIFDTTPKIYINNKVYYLGSILNRAIKCMQLGFKPEFKINEIQINKDTDLNQLSDQLLKTENNNDIDWLKKWSPYLIETHI